MQLVVVVVDGVGALVVVCVPAVALVVGPLVVASVVWVLVKTFVLVVVVLGGNGVEIVRIKG